LLFSGPEIKIEIWLPVSSQFGKDPEKAGPGGGLQKHPGPGVTSSSFLE
jgi:hypothetical protein